MITKTHSAVDSEPGVAEGQSLLVLVRYGSIPEVARFAWNQVDSEPSQTAPVRGTEVVIETDRGTELGTVLESITSSLSDGKTTSGAVLREATADDLQMFQQNRNRADAEFADWQQRICDWKLQLQLIDLEWTLNQDRIILYVLNDRGAETTRLALLAAAAGLGIIHVQPASADGLVHEPKGGGCGSGGCGSGGCGH